MARVDPTGINSENGGSLAATAVQIDLCGSIYGATPGTDITTALQTALNWIAANAPNGGEIYFSKPGTYNINGAQQTGTAQSYSYSGQVLIPAVSLANSMPITIRGPFSASGGGKSTGAPNGVILLSNATSGFVFDIIPSFTQFGCPWTGVMPIFEDIVIRTTDDPLCGGLNMLCTQRFRLANVAIDTPNSFVAPTSGTHEALVLPQVYNNGDVTVRDATIRNYPIGIRLSEHNVLDNVDVANCLIAFRGGGRAHVNWFGYVDVEECPTIFDGGSAPAFGAPTVLAGCALYGALDYENVATTAMKPVAFVNDTSTNPIIGKLDLYGTVSGSHPIVGGQSLDVVPVLKPPTIGPNQRGAGWQETHPYDNFYRVITPLQSGAGTPGQCSPSLHPWRVESGSFSVTSQVLQGLTGADACYVPVWQAGSASSTKDFARSRVITLKFTLGASAPLIRLYACSPVNGSGTASGGGIFGIEAKIAGGAAITLRASNSNILQAGSSLVAGSTHIVQLAVFHDSVGYPYAAEIYLDDVLIIAASIPASLATLTLQNSGTYPYYEDGIFLGDTGSQVTLFAANDIGPTPRRRFTTIITYSASMTPEATRGDVQTIAVTNNTAFTVNAPTSPPIASQSQDLTIEFTNSSGGATTNVAGATWNAAFVLVGGALTDPASTKKRYIRFTWNGAKWIESARASADY